MLEKLSNINQNLTLRQVIEGGATSSLQVYAPKFAHVPASPCLTGWSSCIFALEREWRMKREVYAVINRFFDEASQARVIPVSRSGRMGIAKLSYLRPRVLDLSLSASTLKDCYVIYRNAAPDGRTQSFRLLSGPIFILTRLSLAYAVPERRVGIWKQLLVYLLSVNSLPKGDLRKSFHLADHEKWVELVLPNSESNIIGLRAHKDLKSWLGRPLEQIPDRKAPCKTTKQDFEAIAKSWENSKLSKEIVYNKLVQLRSDLAMEFKYIAQVLEVSCKVLEEKFSSMREPEATPILRPFGKHSDSSPYFPRNRRSTGFF